MMFKATVVEQRKYENLNGIQQADKVVSEYYTYETDDNCILKVLKNNLVKIISIDSSHDSWFLNNNVKKVIYECVMNQ